MRIIMARHPPSAETQRREFGFIDLESQRYADLRRLGSVSG
ncbi:MAG: hypothetical protein ACP5P4_11035 [Steroidobacteraceae bacterium]